MQRPEGVTINPNFRPRREHRRASHIGKIRQRLAKAIERAFANEEIIVQCNPANLWPARGIWKQHHMDVHRWEGQIDVMIGGRMQTRTIESWDKMTDCLKGFTICEDRFSFDVGAVEGKRSATERYVYEG